MRAPPDGACLRCHSHGYPFRAAWLKEPRMYEDGKEPLVRFEVDVTLTEILEAGSLSSFSSMESNRAVELAVILKLMRRNVDEDRRWGERVASLLIELALMSTLPVADDLISDIEERFKVDDIESRYEGVLLEYRFQAEHLADRAMKDIVGYDAAAVRDEHEKQVA